MYQVFERGFILHHSNLKINALGIEIISFFCRHLEFVTFHFLLFTTINTVVYCFKYNVKIAGCPVLSVLYLVWYSPPFFVSLLCSQHTERAYCYYSRSLLYSCDMLQCSTALSSRCS